MVLDNFLLSKLESIKKTFDALTERLADPDVNQDRKQMLELSRERSSLETTVEAFQRWKTLENDRQSLVEMDQATDSSDDLREMVREEIKGIVQEQEKLEEEISVLLLPRDPNDHRNVMLEVRAGNFIDQTTICFRIVLKYLNVTH